MGDWLSPLWDARDGYHVFLVLARSLYTAQMQFMSTSVIGVLFVPITKKSRLLHSSSSITPNNFNKVPGWVSRNLFGSCLLFGTNYWGWNTRPCHRHIPLPGVGSARQNHTGREGNIVFQRKTQVSLCSVLALSVWQAVPGTTSSPLCTPPWIPWGVMCKQISILGRN